MSKHTTATQTHEGKTKDAERLDITNMERDGKTYCDTHHDVETALRCSRCEAYICPKCAVPTTVGYRCRACGRERSASQTLSPAQMLLGSASGFVLGFLCGYFVPGTIGLFLIFLAALLGGFVGQAVSRIIQRKSSVAVGGVTALGFLTGALFEPFQLALSHARSGAEAKVVANAALAEPWALVFAVIAGGVAWYYLK